jgi:Domain of unknown function (DUF4440)
MDPQTIDELRRLNAEIGARENSGRDALDYFNDLLAPAFAFRRASGDVVDRCAYLLALEAGGTRETDPASIEVVPFGDARAIVSCLVSMEVKGRRERFHNVRLFVRDAQKKWRLLAWANERL